MNLWGKMNSGLRKIGLILGLALLLLGCEDPVAIGIDVDKDNIQFDVVYKRFELPGTLVQIDSIPTSNSRRLLTGSYQDPKFGLSKPTSYAELFGRSAPNVDSAAVYDSLILQLQYDYVHGTEIKAENNLKIHRLEERIDGIATFFSFSTFPYFPDPIGDITFKYFLDDNEEVRLDTVLRIPLSNDLGLDFFERLRDDNDTTFTSTESFLNYFHGIALVTGDGYPTVTGFEVGVPESKMTLYYHFTNSDGEIVNRTYDLEMAQGGHVNNFEFDRTGTPISSISTTEKYKEYNTTNGFIYVQSGAGLVAKIDFSPFLDFTDSLESLIINRADLTLGEVELFPNYVVPSESLVYYLTDSTNIRLRAEDGNFRALQQDNPAIDPNGTSFPYETTFNVEDQAYSTPLSSFLQALFDQVITEKHILTYPNFNSNSTTFDRFVIDPRNIILEVYYSTADQSGDNN